MPWSRRCPIRIAVCCSRHPQELEFRVLTICHRVLWALTVSINGIFFTFMGITFSTYGYNDNTRRRCGNACNPKIRIAHHQ
jgi:hypothetical protein